MCIRDRAEYAGNIGVSFADLLLKNDDLDYVVLELSSYQLENLDSFKADIALIINLAPDHLSRYKSVDEYYDTKFNIGKNPTLSDSFILNNDSEEIITRSNFVSGRKIFLGKNNNKERAPGRRKAPGAHPPSAAHGLRLRFPAGQQKGQPARNHFCVANTDCPHKPG